MKLGEVLGRSFKTLGSGMLWAYGATAFLAVAAPFALVWGLLAVTHAPLRLAGLLDSGPADARMLSAIVTMYATFLLGGLLAFIPMLAARGGLIHASNAALAQHPFTVGECWSFGWRRLGRTLGIELLIGIAYFLAIIVAEIPFFLVIALGSSVGGDNNPAAVLGTICCGYLLLLAAIVAIMIVYLGVDAISIRYGLIGDRTVGRAISDGWKAFRVAWKKVIVFAVIMLAMAYAWQALTSLVVAPFMFLVFPLREFIASDVPGPAVMAEFFDSFMWVYVAIIVLYAPFTLFSAIAWTSFFRQLTGMEPADPAGAVTYPPAPPTPPADA